MNKEDYVSLKVAKLLEEKGFNEVCDAGYLIADKEVCPFLFETCQNKGECYVSGFIAAPSLYEALKWLREKYSIHIVAIPTRIDRNLKWYYRISRYLYDKIIFTELSSPKYYDSNEEALDTGLLEMLKTIDNEMDS